MILGILGSRPEEYGLNENGWVGRYFRILDFEYSKILDSLCHENLIIFAYDDDEQYLDNDFGICMHLKVNSIEACMEIACHILALKCLHGYLHSLQRSKGGLEVFWFVSEPWVRDHVFILLESIIGCDFKPSRASNKKIELSGVSPRKTGLERLRRVWHSPASPDSVLQVDPVNSE
jgi:hypothetical protein